MLNNSSLLEHVPVDFQVVFDSLPGNFLVFQPNAPHYTILAISDEAVNTIGREKQSVIGKNLFDVFPDNPEATSPPGPFNLETSLQNALEHKRVDHMPMVRYDVTNPEGKFEERYWAASNKPVMNQQGEVIYLIHTTAEITEQVLTRNRMEESESRFRSMIEQVPVAIGLTRGKDHVFQDINPSMLRIMRKEHKEEAIGKELMKVMPELKDQVMMKILQDVLETGRPYIGSEIPAQVNVQGKLELGYYNLSYTPLMENGKVTGIIHAAYDMTEQVLTRQKVENYAAELQESEQRFRIMADASPVMIWSLAPDATIKYANKFMLEFLGITMEKLKAHNWIPYIHPEDLQRSIHTIGEALEQRQPFQNEHRFLRQDGQHRWLLSQAAPSYYPNGELYGYVGSSVDITEIKQAKIKLQDYVQELAVTNTALRSFSDQVQETNEQLSSSNQQLSQINADMDNFIYTASHDLKVPILNIEGLMTALLDQLPAECLYAESVQPIIDLIQGSVQRFKRTIDHLTEITKLQKEGIPVSSTVDLVRLIADVQLDLATLIQVAQAQIEVNVASCPTIRFSEKNLRSIIYNLLSNAIKYRSPDRTPVIRVNCQITDEYQVLSVQDNGLGIDLSQEHKLFGMFNRLHNHVEGSGIGLYMIKKIIENAGGTIQVQSQIDQGTTFQVYFRRNYD